MVWAARDPKCQNFLNFVFQVRSLNISHNIDHVKVHMCINLRLKHFSYGTLSLRLTFLMAHIPYDVLKITLHLPDGTLALALWFPKFQSDLTQQIYNRFQK